MPTTLIVISDLHLGGGDLLDDCDGELEAHIVSFIEEISERYNPVELIINGDFLDFAQAPPWKGKRLESAGRGIPLCFTQEQSAEKLENVFKAHEPVFKALGRLLAANDENRLVIIPGNHDADFFWPRVRELFVAKVCSGDVGRGGRLDFHLEQVYRPAAFPAAWIEHGHQHDPINSFRVGDEACWSAAAPPIFEDDGGEQRLFECIGTRFLIKFMNHLDARYPFIDNIKPFSRFLNIFGVSVFTWKFGPLKAAVATWAMMRYLLVSLRKHRDDLLSVEASEADFAPASSPELLSKLVSGMDESQREDFRRELDGRGFSVEGSLAIYVSDEGQADALLVFLAENLDLLDRFEEVDDDSYLSFDEEGGQYLALYDAYEFDETQALMEVAHKILKKDDGVGVVVMGHTHERVDPTHEFPYVNPGSWTRYYIFGDDERVNAGRLLKTRAYEVFPYQLNYVEIVPGRTDPSRLITYRKRTS
jgi:UDP-2,3-diacylglucosamine pyrophosphatase LpxH